MASRPSANVPQPLRDSFQALRHRLTRPTTETPDAVAGQATALRLELAVREAFDAGSWASTHVPAEDRTAVLDLVAADCVTWTRGDRRWQLKASVRRRVLQGTERPFLVDALLRVPSGETDDVTLALRWLYVTPVHQPDALTAPQLRSLVAACAWTGTAAPYTYDVRDLQRLLGRRVRSDEYQRVVSGGVFGRSTEISRLVSFLAAPLEPRVGEPRFLYAFGPGGIGKSTIIASAALAAMARDPQTLLVHLDFDRGDLDPLRSSTLDLELLRQAGFADGETDRQLHARHERIRDQLANEEFSGDLSKRQLQNLEVTVSLSKSVLVGALAESPMPRPLLIVLDTFEQIEAGGPLSIEALKRWLYEIAAVSGAQEVRVVVSGRTEPGERAFPGAAPEDLLPLGELDAGGAADLLRARQVPDALGVSIYETFGGNPLVLRLAADLVTQVGPDAIARIAADARAGTMPREMVQGLLYDRFLKHIDAPADAYAHPGLVLPQITVDLIRHVLAPAQGREPHEVEAEAIYEALGRATWLIRLSPDGQSLTQRRDLRQLMLQLMHSDPARAESIEKVRALAIAYHSRFPDSAHRAFAVYHRLMVARTQDDLRRLLDIDFAEIAAELRPHMDDLPAAARAFVQARMARNLGAEQALESLPDEAWTRYLAGDGYEPGEGDRLVQATDPMLALKLWRRRPVHVNGQVPTFVVQALAETGEWDDAAADAALAGLGAIEDDPASVERLYWLTRLALLRGRGLGDAVRDRVSSLTRGDKAEHLSLAAVVEALDGRRILPEGVLSGGEFASETRLYLVHSTTFGGTRHHFTPPLDALIVLQRDWSARFRARYMTQAEEWIEALRRAWSAVKSRVVPAWRDRLGPGGPAATPRVYRHRVVDEAQAQIDAMHGEPLDSVSRRLRDLRRPVIVDLTRRGLAGRVLILRGLTPEFHRPVRQALCEALTTEAQVRRFMARVRPAFTICPADLEPDEFVPRARRDPTMWFLSLVQSADRARVMESLLIAARAEAPDHLKLRRMHEAWVAWDRALSGGLASDWVLSADKRPDLPPPAPVAATSGAAR